MSIFTNDDLTPDFWKSEGFVNLGRSSDVWIKWEYFISSHWLNIKIIPSRLNGYVLKYIIGVRNTSLYEHMYHIDDKVDWEAYKEKMKAEVYEII